VLEADVGPGRAKADRHGAALLRNWVKNLTRCSATCHHRGRCGYRNPLASRADAIKVVNTATEQRSSVEVIARADHAGYL